MESVLYLYPLLSLPDFWNHWNRIYHPEEGEYECKTCAEMRERFRMMHEDILSLSDDFLSG